MPTPLTASSLSQLGRVTQYALALLSLAACLAGILLAGQIGIARMLAMYGVTVNVLPAATEAARLNPADPEVHYARARALLNAGQVAVALGELERAVALQPRNYGLWLELGGTYDLAGKPEAAIMAVTRAIKLAPAYAQPHWQLGNLLLRAGRRLDGFAEFRLAVNSDSTFMPNAVDLAWGAFKGDTVAIEEALQPQTSFARLELARVFAARGAVDDAMRLFRTVTDRSERTAGARESLQAELLTAQRYYEAKEVWAVGRAVDASNGLGAITDGSFEQEISFTEAGFGWRINQDKPALAVSLDSQEPYADATSLQIRWEGKSWPSVLIASQLVLVEPNKRYKLGFAARTKELVSGGLPEIVVLESPAGQVLASASLAEGTNKWQAHPIEFTAPAESRTVVVAIRRKACTSVPCPAFGIAWFDAFSMQANG